MEDKLEAGRPNSFPDMLISIPAERAHFRMNSDVFLHWCESPLWAPERLPQIEQDQGEPEQDRAPEGSVLYASRNKRTAVAVGVWLSDAGEKRYKPPPPGDKTPEAAAMRVLSAVLQGKDPGADADPEIAGLRPIPVPPYRPVPGMQPTPTPTRLRPTLLRQAVVPTDTILIDVGPVESTARLAAVTLRAVGGSRDQFGVAHALAVLRKDDAGAWRVLQLSPYLPGDRQRQGLDLLRRATRGQATSNPLGNEGTHPLGVSQAAPLDGDTRVAPAEMGWDNLGGSSLQVVEWQTREFQATWLSHLFFLPDIGSRLKTQFTATFAQQPGTYRWRVWSVGSDGTIALSPWRTLTIVGQ